MGIIEWPMVVLLTTLCMVACGLTQLAQHYLRSGPPWPDRQATSNGWHVSCPACLSNDTGRALLPKFWRSCLRGCRYCAQRFGWWHCTQQSIFVITNLTIFGMLGWQTASFAYFVFTCYCFLLCTIDWQQQWLPNSLTLSLIGLGLVAAYTHIILIAWPDACIGSIAAFLTLELIAACYQRLRGREGLGGGDSKLLAALGAWFGWAPLPLLVAIAAGIGITVVCWKIWRQNASAQHHIAFGPCLCLACLWPLYWQIQHGAI